MENASQSQNATTNTNNTFHSFTSNSEEQLKAIYKEVNFIQDVYIIPIICPIGIIGNSLVASVLFSKRRYNSSFIYMFSVLLVDTLSLVSDLSLPISRLLTLSPSEDLAEQAALMKFFSMNVVGFILRSTAINILCVLSAERLMAIKNPFKLCSSCTVKRPKMFLFLALAVSCISNLLPAIFTKIGPVKDKETNETVYTRVYTNIYKENKDACDKILIFTEFIEGPIPVLLFAVMNAFIIHELYKNRQTKAVSENKIRKKSIKNVQVRLCKIFLVLCFMNMLAFLPNSMTTIIVKSFPKLGMDIKSYRTKLFLYGGNFLKIINSMSDFIVLLGMSAEIRKDLKRRFLLRNQADPETEFYSISRDMNTRDVSDEA